MGQRGEGSEGAFVFSTRAVVATPGGQCALDEPTLTVDCTAVATPTGTSSGVTVPAGGDDRFIRVEDLGENGSDNEIGADLDKDPDHHDCAAGNCGHVASCRCLRPGGNRRRPTPRLLLRTLASSLPFGLTAEIEGTMVEWQTPSEWPSSGACAARWPTWSASSV